MNKMMTFAEYVAMREGLWLNDKNAVPGISKIMTPKPPKTARPTPPPKIKPPHVPKSEGSLDQLHQSVDELGKLGIGLLPPRKEDLKRLMDKQKNQVTVPKAPARAPGSPVERPAAAAMTWGSSWSSPPCSDPHRSATTMRPPSRP